MAEILKPDFSEIWASSGSVIAPDDSKIRQGWVEEQPSSQHENYLQRRQDEAIKYLFQHGIGTWDATEEYFSKRSVVLHNGDIYISQTNNINKTPSPTSTDWKTISNLKISDIGGLQTELNSKASKTELNTGLSGKVNTTQKINATNGILGGGTLAGDVTISMGTPSTITQSSTNSATGSTHSHSIDKASTTVAGVVKLNNTLTSDSTTEALTAAQGKVLAEMVSSGSAAGALLKNNNLSDLPNPSHARTNLGLGTASTMNTVASIGDLVAGRVLTVGWMGMGGFVQTLDSTADIDQLYKGSKYMVTGDNPKLPSNGDGVLVIEGVSDKRSIQTFTQFGSGRTWTRSCNGGAWGAFREVWNSINFDPNTKVSTATQVVAGNGLSGGGLLSSNITVSMGTPSEISTSTANGVAGNTHTHALSESVKSTLVLANNSLQKTSNLADLTNTTTARNNLGLGSAATTSASDYAAKSHTHSWGEITGKPTTFTPSGHTHAWGQITGAPATATRWPTWNEVSSKPAIPPTQQSLGYTAIGQLALVITRYNNTNDRALAAGSTVAGSNLVRPYMSVGQAVNSYRELRVNDQNNGVLSGTWRVLNDGHRLGSGTTDTSTPGLYLAIRIS